MKHKIVIILSAIFQAIDTLLCKLHIKRPTVVMNIVGGICSQMLQYIQGQYYKDIANVYYDISWYGKDQFRECPRSFELLQMWPNIPFKTTSKLQMKWYYLFFSAKKTEADWLPEPSLLSRSVYLCDDWDLPTDVSKKLWAQYFNMRMLASPEVKSCIVFENIVGIHVRRGDLANGDNPYYGGVTDGYFLRAIEFCNKKFHPQKYLFFSDEPDWVEQNICTHLEQPYEIMRGNKAWEDLWLLTQCPVIVASQGSFGKVAASLNPKAVLIQCDNQFANRDRKNTYLIE